MEDIVNCILLATWTSQLGFGLLLEISLSFSLIVCHENLSRWRRKLKFKFASRGWRWTNEYFNWYYTARSYAAKLRKKSLLLRWEKEAEDLHKRFYCTTRVKYQERKLWNLDEIAICINAKTASTTGFNLLAYLTRQEVLSTMNIEIREEQSVDWSCVSCAEFAA